MMRKSGLRVRRVLVSPGGGEEQMAGNEARVRAGD